MVLKKILCLPSGQFLSNGQSIQFDDKFKYIIDNFKNPYLPIPLVIMDNKEIGRAKDYHEMQDGLYFSIELNDDIDLQTKYPVCEIKDYEDKNGVHYQNVLTKITFKDEPCFIGNKYKELNKELQMPNPENYTDEKEWMKVCVPTMVNEGKDQSQAVAACMAMWKNKTTGQVVTPEKKSKIDILSSIKKLIEKNGYAISDEKILEMFGNIQEGKGYLQKLNRKLDKSKNIHEIKVFPKKTVFIEKYDEYINFDNKLFTEMIDAFNCDKLFKPYVDEDHQLGEKFADILELINKDDGLYAKIQLNEKGISAIKNNIYSYISPEWGDRTDTEGNLHKNVLWAITLTNIPALEGENPKLQDQIKTLSKKLYGGKKMDLKNKLSNLEGKVSNFRLADEAAPAIPPEMLEAIQMIKDAIAAIDQMIQEKDQVVKEKEQMAAQKEVAEKTAIEYKEKFDKIETEKKTAEKEKFFEEVVTKGQLKPDEVDDWKLQYEKSKDFVVKILTSRPAITGSQQSTTKLDGKADEVMYKGKKYKLTTEDYKIMANQKFDRNNPKDVDRYIAEVLEDIKE